MNRFIYKENPYDYEIYIAPHSVNFGSKPDFYLNYLSGIEKGIKNNNVIKNLFNKYFNIISDYENYPIYGKSDFISNFKIVGNSIDLSGDFKIDFGILYADYIGLSYVLKVDCNNFSIEDYDSSYPTREKYTWNNQIIVREQSFINNINVAELKHGGMVFWFNFNPNLVFFVTSLHNSVNDIYSNEIFTIFEDKLYYSLGDTTKEFPYTAEPSFIKSTGRQDFRGFNLTNSDKYYIYPLYISNIDFRDIFYYDGGTSYIGDKEIVYLDDRVFLCPHYNKNLLLELKVEEDDE